MRRVQIMLDEAVDAELERRAAVEGVSKAALIRRLVGAGLEPAAPIEEDPLMAMAGADDFESAPIDDVVYR